MVCLRLSLTHQLCFPFCVSVTPDHHRNAASLVLLHPQYTRKTIRGMYKGGVACLHTLEFDTDALTAARPTSMFSPQTPASPPRHRTRSRGNSLEFSFRDTDSSTAGSGRPLGRVKFLQYIPSAGVVVGVTDLGQAAAWPCAGAAPHGTTAPLLQIDLLSYCLAAKHRRCVVLMGVCPPLFGCMHPSFTPCFPQRRQTEV